MNALETSLYGLLKSDASVTDLLATPNSVYSYSAPENAALPVVIFFQQTETPDYTLEARAYTNCLYGVKGVVQGASMKDAEVIDEAIDALLTDATFPVNGESVLYCRRENSIAPYTEITSGVRYNHAGGSYRIFIGGK